MWLDRTQAVEANQPFVGIWLRASSCIGKEHCRVVRENASSVGDVDGEIEEWKLFNEIVAIVGPGQKIDNVEGGLVGTASRQ